MLPGSPRRLPVRGTVADHRALLSGATALHAGNCAVSGPPDVQRKRRSVRSAPFGRIIACIPNAPAPATQTDLASHVHQLITACEPMSDHRTIEDFLAGLQPRLSRSASVRDAAGELLEETVEELRVAVEELRVA